MRTITELRQQLTESQGLRSMDRLPILHNIWGGCQAIERAAAARPFEFPLETIQQLRAFLPEVDAAISRAKAGLARTKVGS